MGIGVQQKIVVGVYVLLLTALASKAYFNSSYDIDMMGYIGNAVAISGAGIAEIHDTAYRAAASEMPDMVKDHLLGKDMEGSPSQWKSRQDRAVNAYDFAEYLPCFAIRPIYNELLYILHYKLGIGLVWSTIVIAVISYWLTGLLVFRWLTLYLSAWRAAVCSIFLMLAPPILGLARMNTPDGLSCLVCLAALYLIFERESLFWGLTLLCVSVYVRTDNVLLVLATLCYCSLLTKKLGIAKAAVLAALAVGSVEVINHFAGDYGMRMQYYRAFVAIPLAPAELVPKFGLADYMHAFKGGVSLTMYTSFPLFVFMGVVSLVAGAPGPIRTAVLLTFGYAIAHFVLFPAVQERFYGVFYVAAGLALAISTSQRSLSRAAVPA